MIQTYIPSCGHWSSAAGRSRKVQFRFF